MELINIALITFLSVLLLVYLYFKRAFSYWKSKGIPYIRPSIPYGNLGQFGKTIHASQFMQEVYTKFRNVCKFCGVYFFGRPVAILIDLELVKSVLLKDFHNFNDRGLYHSEKHDPLSSNLFTLQGQKWKALRAKLTFTFTSAKMKFMFPTIVEVGDRFRECLFDIVKENDELDIKELLARFTTDIIGTCAFGIECHSLKDPDSEFRNMGRAVLEKPRHNKLIFTLIHSFRSTAEFFRTKVIRNDVTEFFLKVVRDTVEYREKNNVTRNDFMDLLIKLKNEEQTDKTEDALTISKIAASAYTFFLAGFETSSTTLTFCFYELAQKPDLQAKARKEIRDALKRHGGKLTYEAALDMPFVDQIIYETLRLYPPVSFLSRYAKNDYPVPNTDILIEKDTKIWIPVFAIQRDPEFYPQPNEFKPERFTAEEISKRDSVKWLPFGDGPRNCVGLRFGLMQTRIGFITLINNFEFSLSSKTEVPLVYNPSSFILTSRTAIYLKLRPIN